MGRTIIISNRLPVKISQADGSYIFQQSEGGLATGLGSIYKDGNNIWLGWPGLFIDDLRQRKIIDKQLADLNLFPVYLTNEDINQYYEGFSNEILWPVFHYMPTYAHYENKYREYYYAVNRKFCDAFLSLYQPGDIVWIHDYHLLLLPKMIRDAQPGASIGFFQHIPFPSFEIFRSLPWRKELLEGLLGANLIGFHTYDDTRHFLSACSGILSLRPSINTVVFEGRKVVAESFPMGIDDKKFEALTNDLEVCRHISSLRQSFGDLRLILTIDRLDYSKGILQRLQAFNLLLETEPVYREKVSLYMIVVPSRDNVPLYRELRNEIDKLAGNINARYRTNTWTPINYFYRSFPVEMLSALYQVADVCLVTPMRDGMNLVCKEFVSSRIHDDGVLILSEMAGAAKELIDAVIVNPNNIAEMCHAMTFSLNMPAGEQHQRMKRMRALVSKYNVHHWSAAFMKRLRELSRLPETKLAKQTGFLTGQLMRNRYVRAKKRLILLDYDGTLVNFSDDIDAVSPDKELYEILQTLTDDKRNRVVIISGRKHTKLEEWFGNMQLDLVAEHGVWQKSPGSNWNQVSGIEPGWKKQLYPILQVFSDRTPGAFVEEKSNSLAWHYRKAEDSLGEFRANELMGNIRYLVSDLPLQVLPGNKVVEVKSSDVNKGRAASSFIQSGKYQFILAIGDDVTDEDMFKAVKPNGFTINVGTERTVAEYYFKDPKEARALLSGLPSKLLISKLLDKVIHIIPYPPYTRSAGTSS